MNKIKTLLTLAVALCGGCAYAQTASQIPTYPYIYVGAAGNLGRFGAVVPGQTLNLTGPEVAAYLAGQGGPIIPALTVWAIPKNVTSSNTLATAASGDSGKKIILAATNVATVVFLPAAPTAGDNFSFQYDPWDTTVVTIDPGFTNAIYGTNGSLLLGDTNVASVTVTTNGTACTNLATVTFSGGNGTNAVAVCTMKALTATVQPGQAGTNYAVGDTVVATNDTGTLSVWLVTVVSNTSNLQTLVVTNAGLQTAIGTNFHSVVAGPGQGTVGTGGKLNLTYGVASIQVTSGGRYYGAVPTVAFATSGGLTGAAATAVLQNVPGTYSFPLANGRYALFWNSSYWQPY